jgi:four helix bundle protein
MAVERFEDLLAWQRARTLAHAVHQANASGPFERDYELRRQIGRAAVSIAANIAEGFERGSRAEFAQFLSVAKGSCGEVRSHLYIAADRGHLSEAQFAELMELANEVARLVAGLRTAVSRQRDEQRRTPTRRSES